MLLLSAAACGGEEAARPPVADSAYVEAMARMVLLDTAVSPNLESPLTGAALDSARQRILDTYGVDAEQLLEFARTRGDDPRRMQAIWARVYQLSDSLREEEWRPLPDSAPPPGGEPLPGEAADTASGTADELADTAREAGPGRGGR